MEAETPAMSAVHDQDRQRIIETALYYLMSRFVVYPCAWIAQAIVHHLEMLLELRGSLPGPAKLSVYESLSEVWRAIERDQMQTKPRRDAVA